MKKHVAIYIPSLRGGGAERSMLTLANGLAAKGYEIDLVLVKNEGPYISIVSDHINVIDLNQNRTFYSIKQLRSYLNRRNPDVLISAMPHINIVAVMAKVFSRSSTKVVVSERNSINTSPTTKGKIYKWLKLWAYKKADSVTSVSEDVSQQLQDSLGLPKEKITTIYNPVVNNEILEKANESITHPWFKEGDKPVILGVGRLTEQKDFKTLIKAFSLVKEKFEAKLMILGEGEERQDLEELIEKLNLSDEVDLMGFVDNPFKYMKNSKVFVLSSKWEGLPGVLIQAMACGTPVISTDCPGGSAEIIEDGRWGKLIRVNDHTALADSILDTLQKDVHPEVAKRAQDFHEDNAIGKYISLVQSL